MRDWDKDEICYLKVTECSGETPTGPILAMSSVQAKAWAGSEQDCVRFPLGQGNRTKDYPKIFGKGGTRTVLWVFFS